MREHSESTKRYMAAAVAACDSLSRMFAADTSMPARTERAYAASKQAHAVQKSPAPFAWESKVAGVGLGGGEVAAARADGKQKVSRKCLGSV